MSVFFRRRGPVDLGPQLPENFADNSWADIIWACQTGNVPSTWTVGSQKTMTINGTDYAIDIIGRDHDAYADGSGTAPLTFQLHHLYNAQYAWGSTASNSGGWGSSKARSTHLPAILKLMPSEVQSAIKQVNKLTSAGSKSSTIKTTADKLFLLSEVEAFGSISQSFAGEGSQYAYYAAGGSTKKKNSSGFDTNWWLRSPYKNGTSQVCIVISTGGISFYDAAGTNMWLSPAFCF